MTSRDERSMASSTIGHVGAQSCRASASKFIAMCTIQYLLMDPIRLMRTPKGLLARAANCLFRDGRGRSVALP